MSATNFYQQQFKETGLTQVDNHIQVRSIDDEYAIRDFYLYSEANRTLKKDSNGILTDETLSADVLIQFPDLYGGLYTTLTDSKNTPTKVYSRVRFEEPRKKEDGSSMKYKANGSGIYPFFNKLILNAYTDGIEIKTLYLTEGEKKSSRMCSLGYYAVGLTGIQMWRSGKADDTLHHDIEELIQKCKVQHLVFLKDADAVSINYHPENDLSSRPSQFHANILKFADATSHLIDSERFSIKKVVYGHIHKSHIDEAKGIDDLMNLNRVDELDEKSFEKLSPIEKERYEKGRKKYLEHLQEINRDIEDLYIIGKYFRFFDLHNPQGIKNLTKEFGLLDARNFHAVYSSTIGNRPFTFKRKQYQHDGSEVVFMRHKDTELFFYVHDTLYKKVEKINAKAKVEYEYKPIREAFVKHQYKSYPNFLDQVGRFESFCLVPNHTENFKLRIGNSFNLYHPLKQIPQKGEFKYIYKFLKHLFRGKSTIEFDQDGNWKENFTIGDPFAVMIDWMTILIQKPLQKLPVPCLYSPENGTGKSSFLGILEEILGENASILGNQEFQMGFNAHYVTKSFIGLDEAFIELDKKAEKERLKKMVTQKTAFLQYKGKDLQKIDFFAKFVFCTNDEKFMKIEAGETRWYVLRVFPFAEQDRVANMLDDYMIPECNMLLYYLLNRQVFHPYTSRTWFDERLYLTDQFKTVVEATRNYTEVVIDEYIADLFLEFKIKLLRLTNDFILTGLSKIKMRYPIDSKILKEYLQKKKGMALSDRVMSLRMPQAFISENGMEKISFQTGKGRTYEFNYSDWLSKEQIQQFEVIDKEMDEIHRNSGLHVPKRNYEQLSITEQNNKPYQGYDAAVGF